MKHMDEIQLSIYLVVISCSLIVLGEKPSGYNYEEPLLYDKFPDDFLWGTATASYQVNVYFLRKLKNKLVKVDFS